MEQQPRLGARHALGRVLGRALLLVGGTVGGTLLGWSLAAGTAHADTMTPVAPDGPTISTVAGPLLGAAGDPLNQVSGVPDVNPAAGNGGLLAAGPLTQADRLIPEGEPLRAAADGLLQATAPARSTVRGVAGTLASSAPVTINPGGGPLANGLGTPLFGGGQHAVPPKHPMRSEPTSAGSPGLGGPQAAVAAVNPTEQVRRAAGRPLGPRTRFATQHLGAARQTAPERRAPAYPFTPSPAAPLPSATGGPAAASGVNGAGAVPQQFARSLAQRTLALPRPSGPDHRLGARTPQPGVTPD